MFTINLREKNYNFDFHHDTYNGRIIAITKCICSIDGFADDKSLRLEIPKNFHIKPGFGIAKITMAECYFQDTFVKSVGRKLALKRCLEELSKDSQLLIGHLERQQIWNKYLSMVKK